MKVAAIADLHCKTDSQGKIIELLDGVNRLADVLVMAGDLTDRGRLGYAIVIMMGFILLLVAYCTIRFLLTLHRNEFTDLE